MRRTLIVLLVSLIFGALVAPSSRGWDYWAPRLGPAINYAESRQGSISFAVVDELGKVHGYRRHRTVPAASVFKVMLMTAYLRQDSVRMRALNNSDKSLLGPMITFSDNASASRINNMLGAGPINRLARVANMRDILEVGDVHPEAPREIRALSPVAHREMAAMGDRPNEASLLAAVLQEWMGDRNGARRPSGGVPKEA